MVFSNSSIKMFHTISGIPTGFDMVSDEVSVMEEGWLYQRICALASALGHQHQSVRYEYEHEYNIPYHSYLKYFAPPALRRILYTYHQPQSNSTWR